MVVCRYEISLLVVNSTSHSFAALTRKLSSKRSKRNSISTHAMYYSPFALILGEIITLRLLKYAEVLDLTSTVSSKNICKFIHS